jgi:hypothetical protein
MGGMNLFGMGPGQLDELQRLRRQKMEADTLAQRTQGLSPARARAYSVGFRAAGGVGNALGLINKQEDTDITQARAVQRAANDLAQTPEFQNMNPFEKRAALAQAQAAELAKMGNVQLANQFYEMAGKAQSEGALLGTRQAQLSAVAQKQEQQRLLANSMEGLQGSREFKNLDPSEQFRRASEETLKVALETNDINLYQSTAKELADFDRQERNSAAQAGARELQNKKLRQELGIVIENGQEVDTESSQEKSARLAAESAKYNLAAARAPKMFYRPTPEGEYEQVFGVVGETREGRSALIPVNEDGSRGKPVFHFITPNQYKEAGFAAAATPEEASIPEKFKSIKDLYGSTYFTQLRDSRAGFERSLRGYSTVLAPLAELASLGIEPGVAVGDTGAVVRLSKRISDALKNLPIAFDASITKPGTFVDSVISDTSFQNIAKEYGDLIKIPDGIAGQAASEYAAAMGGLIYAQALMNQDGVGTGLSDRDVRNAADMVGASSGDPKFIARRILNMYQNAEEGFMREVDAALTISREFGVEDDNAALNLWFGGNVLKNIETARGRMAKNLSPILSQEDLGRLTSGERIGTQRSRAEAEEWFNQ